MEASLVTYLLTWNHAQKKQYLAKIRLCIQQLKSSESEYKSLKKLIDEGFFKHFKNIKMLQEFKQEFYYSSEYKVLNDLHVEAILSHSGEV